MLHIEAEAETQLAALSVSTLNLVPWGVGPGLICSDRLWEEVAALRILIKPLNVGLTITLERIDFFFKYGVRFQC